MTGGASDHAPCTWTARTYSALPRWSTSRSSRPIRRVRSPPDQDFARPLEPPSNKRPKRSGRSLRSSPRQAGQAGEHRLCFLEPDVRNLSAIAGVPAQRRPPEPSRVVDQEQDELEGVWEADEVELSGRSQGNRWVAGVEGAAEAAVGRALRGHEQMFPRLAVSGNRARYPGRGIRAPIVRQSWASVLLRDPP